MNYNIDVYLAQDDTFKFMFDDRRWISIDLVNDYPNYNIINSSTEFITIIDKNHNITEIYNDNLREYKKYYKKLATQTQYDEWCFNNSKKNDNAKLYELLNDLYNRNIMTTIII